MDECPVEEEMQDWIELNEKAEDFPQLVSQKEALKGQSVLGSQCGSVKCTILLFATQAKHNSSTP